MIKATIIGGVAPLKKVVKAKEAGNTLHPLKENQEVMVSQVLITFELDFSSLSQIELLQVVVLLNLMEVVVERYLLLLHLIL